MIAEKQCISTIGFDGPTPKFAIIWDLGAERRAKTLCYSEKELEEQISMHAWKYRSYEVMKDAG